MTRTPHLALDEGRAIELLQRQLGSRAKGVTMGIGDDAAVLEARGDAPLVWSVDASIEGVHFDLRWLSLRQAAARAFVAALSDLAAMGATPTAALCALGVPAHAERSQFSAVGRGQADVARRYGCPVVGGNLTRDSRWSFTTTVLGRVPQPGLRRNDALPGHQLWLIGELGAAAAGLRLLSQAAPGRLRGPGARARAHCIRAWRSPEAHIAVARTLHGKASAVIDVSDGLASEAQHLARSSACKIVLDGELLGRACRNELRSVAVQLGIEPLELMLFGGEDYALLATGPRERRPKRGVPLGWVERGRGVWLELNGRRQRVQGGFDHLRSP